MEFQNRFFFICPEAKFQLQTYSSRFQINSKSTFSVVISNTSSYVLLFFLTFFRFFTFRCAFEKFSIVNNYTFKNFDHNYLGLNIVYHRMSLLFHQKFTFSDLMLCTVKRK